MDSIGMRLTGWDRLDDVHWTPPDIGNVWPLSSSQFIPIHRFQLAKWCWPIWCLHQDTERQCVCSFIHWFHWFHEHFSRCIDLHDYGHDLHGNVAVPVGYQMLFICSLFIICDFLFVVFFVCFLLQILCLLNVVNCINEITVSGRRFRRLSQENLPKKKRKTLQNISQKKNKKIQKSTILRWKRFIFTKENKQFIFLCNPNVVFVFVIKKMWINFNEKYFLSRF